MVFKDSGNSKAPTKNGALSGIEYVQTVVKGSQAIVKVMTFVPLNTRSQGRIKLL